MKVFEQHAEYGNAILEKSFRFGIRTVKFYVMKNKEQRSLDALFKQLLRSGTSIGANVSESQEAASKKDFINKLSIALKEARESEYWLRLLKESLIITEKEFTSLANDCDELIRLLISIMKTLKAN